MVCVPTPLQPPPINQSLVLVVYALSFASLQLQLNAIEAEIATAKGHRKHYRDKKNEVLKRITNMEAELQALSEDAEVCDINL